jgi:hypothetical protein
MTRCPVGARPYRRVMAKFTLNSSTNFKSRRSNALIFWR